MFKRIIIVLIFFIPIIGSGIIWLLYNIKKQKILLRYILSLPKIKRYFWYKLRNDGYKFIQSNFVKNISLNINNYKKIFTFKSDFIVKKNSKKYACIFYSGYLDKDFIKIFFCYINIFKVNGVIFYNENEKSYNIWEL